MSRVAVMFLYVGSSRAFRSLSGGVLRYVVRSNNLAMGIAIARDELWKDLDVRDGRLGRLAKECGVTRIDFRPVEAAKVAVDCD